MIKVGFIGAGDIAYLHGEGVNSSANARLTGIWNRTRSKAEEKAELFGTKVFDSPEELIEAVDVVYILTNMETHHRYAIQCIEAGKHVLVEKPTAVTIAEIEEIKEAANRKGVHVAPVHNYIYEPTVMRAKDLIESGKLGEIVSIYVLYNIHHPEEVAARYRCHSANSHAPCLLHALPRGSSQNGILHESYDKRRQRTAENLAMVTLQMQNNRFHTCAQVSHRTIMRETLGHS